MKIPARAAFTATLTLVLGAALCVQPTASQNKSQRSHEQLQALSPKQIAAVVVAIEDEIYDYSDQEAFLDVGRDTNGPMGRSFALPVYVNPHLRADGTGEVIYKKMPYGEVLREFHINPSGMVVFNSDPEIGFPVTQPSHLTLFMDDSELCQDKTHWRHREFTILYDPPRDFVVQAAKRQLTRVSFSAFLDAPAGPRSK